MAVGAVGANANEICSVPLDGFVCVTEALRLAVSAGGEVLRVEVECYGPAVSPFGESELPAVMAESLEAGCYCPWLEHSHVHSREISVILHHPSPGARAS